MPHKVWVIGEETLAADFNTFVQQQVIAGFPTVAARASGIAAPARAQASYVAVGDGTEGPEYWNGVAWRKPWNQPWGVLGIHGLNTPYNSGIQHTIAQPEGLQITLPNEVANRMLKATYVHNLYTPGGPNGVNVALDRALVGKQQWGYPPEAMSVTAGHHGTWVWVGPSIASATPLLWRLTIFASNNNTQVSSFANAAFTRQLIIEDIGPNGAPA